MRSIALVIALLTISMPAQEPAFKAVVSLVSVPVAVMDGERRRHIDGLDASDFRVFEDDVVQEVAVLDRDRRPVSLVIVADASGSMGEGVKQLLAVRGIRETVAKLDPADEFAAVTFAKEAKVVVPWTAVHDSAAVSFDLHAEGESALHDGLTLGLRVLEQARHPKRAILLVTDGFENNSKTSLKEAITTRRQSETLVYAFGLSSMLERRPGTSGSDRYDAGSPGPGPTLTPWSGAASGPNTDVLPALVGDSGGIVFRIGAAPQASAAARALVDDLKFQYTLGYTPLRAFDGKYRRIKVEVNRRGVTVRHRSGYIATAVP